jgi:Zn-dependent peptidase ImmA (M78 family)/transcriptional regulator with XRE-family HTH domain
MNQTEAAGALKITAAALSHYESGKRKVEALTLESLSRLYGVALGYFFGEDEPRVDWEVALRSLAQNLSPQGKAGISHLIAQVHNLEELYRLTGTACPGMLHPPFPCLVEEHFSNYEVAEYAEKFRRYYDLGVAPLLDLRGFLEALGYQIFAVSLGKLPDDLKGFFFQDSKLGPIITVNADRAISCRSFTLAHELAHSLYHYDRPPILCRQNDVRLLEQFANRFSSYFLIPDEALHERLRQLRVKTVTRPEDVIHLARYFGVSFEVMYYRLHSEHRLDDSSKVFDKVKPVALAKALGYSPLRYEFSVGPLPPEERLPRVFLELAYRAVQQKQISLRRAAELLNISDIEIEERLYSDEAEGIEQIYA